MSIVSQQILSLAKQLFPGGRAFSVPPQRKGTGEIYTDEDGNYLTDEDGNFLVTEDWTEGYGGWLEKFLKAFGGDGGNRMGTLERCYNDAYSIYGHILPLANNDKFTDGTVDPRDNDCNDFEQLLGLVQYGVTSALTPTRLDRMAAIRTKMRYPGTDAPRQAAGYLQAQLQSAGFDVYVYENIFMPGGVTKTVAEVLGVPAGSASYGSFDYGEVDYGATYLIYGVSIIANYIDEAKDIATTSIIGDGYRGTFFISGNPITTFADVPLVRKAEFRQMILRLKPAHEKGFLIVNYI